jgi:hypothetical protein
VPYTPAGAAAYDEPREPRSWLMPIVAVAAIVLLALAALSGYLVVNSGRNASTATGTNPGSSSSGGTSNDSAKGGTLPANASEEDKVKEVIRVSNENQITAWKDLNEDILKKSYTGKALSENVAMVRDLRANKIHAVPVNSRLDILSVAINGDKATAHTLEVWTVAFYSQTDNKKVGDRGPDTLKETYFLVKENGSWYINDLVIENDQQPTPGGDT